MKYVRDLRRREPRNVGVLVQAAGEVAVQFLGQSDEGRVDGRRLRGLGVTTDVYQSWVDYFTRKAVMGEWEDLEHPRSSRPRSFYVDVGGVSLEPVDSAGALASALFAELVAQPVDEGSGDALRQAVDRVLTLARVVPEENVTVEGRFGPHARPMEVTFDMRYVNGQPHLMQRVNVGAPNAESSARDLWARIEAAKYADSARSFLAFYSSAATDSEERLDHVLGTLDELAHTVDVASIGEAAEKVRDLVHA